MDTPTASFWGELFSTLREERFLQVIKRGLLENLTNIYIYIHIYMWEHHLQIGDFQIFEQAMLDYQIWLPNSTLSECASNIRGPEICVGRMHPEKKATPIEITQISAFSPKYDYHNLITIIIIIISISISISSSIISSIISSSIINNKIIIINNNVTILPLSSSPFLTILYYHPHHRALYKS